MSYLSPTPENLSFLSALLAGLCLALCAVCFLTAFHKQVFGGFVRKLIGENCLSPETAKSLPELGFAAKLWIRYGVRKSVTLRRVVRCREEEEYEQKTADQAASYHEQRAADPSLPKKFRPLPFRVSPDEHHFYISEDEKYMADMKFEAKGNGWAAAVLLSVIIIAITLLLIFNLTAVLEWLNRFFGPAESLS